MYNVLKSHAWIIDPFKVQDKPGDFNVTEYKRFVDRVLVSTLQINIKKLPLVEFSYHKESHIIHFYCCHKKLQQT